VPISQPAGKLVGMKPTQLIKVMIVYLAGLGVSLYVLQADQPAWAKGIVCVALVATAVIFSSQIWAFMGLDVEKFLNSKRPPSSDQTDAAGRRQD